MDKKEIARITHFFSKISVAAIKLTDTLKIGDRISIEGAHTNFEMVMSSMQIDRKDVVEAKAGDEVGFRVSEKVREGDAVFKITE